jgi:hypothetical protein
VQWEFETPLPIRSFTLQMAPPPTRQAAALPNGELYSSDDGIHWKKIVSIPGTPQYVSLMGSRTYAFPPVQASYFRVTMKRAVFDLDARLRGNVAPNFFQIIQLDLSALRRGSTSSRTRRASAHGRFPCLR